MSEKSNRFSQQYLAALRKHLMRGARASSPMADPLGRQVVDLGLETLELARVHKLALAALVPTGGSARSSAGMIQRARAFFAEAVAPIEMTHRAALTAGSDLKRVNRTLRQRSVESSASVRHLNQGIRHRREAEAALKMSGLQRKEVLEESRRLQQLSRLLTHEILSTQENEWQKISPQLHNEIAQVLTGINVQLATLKTEATVNTRGITRNISRTQRLVEKSVDIVPRFARELRPALLDDLELIPALHSYLKEFAKQTGLSASLTAFTAGRIKELNSTGRTTVHRVAQEALNNVARHAQATRVEASIAKVPRGLCLRIKDDGRSFEVERVLHARKNRRLGLIGMRERVEMVGGKFTVESALGQGTTTQAQIPLGHGRCNRCRGKPVREAFTRSTR